MNAVQCTTLDIGKSVEMTIIYQLSYGSWLSLETEADVHIPAVRNIVYIILNFITAY